MICAVLSAEHEDDASRVNALRDHQTYLSAVADAVSLGDRGLGIHWFEAQEHAEDLGTMADTVQGWEPPSACS